MTKRRCEGWRRRGGVFTLGPVSWSQCERDATVLLKVKQDDETKSYPACVICWNKAVENHIEILHVTPLSEDAKRIHGPSITCPRCQRTSYHPEDIRQRYCGHCHAFHADLM